MSDTHDVTDQSTILAAAKAAWLKAWECGLLAEAMEAQLRRPMPAAPLADVPAADRAQAARAHAEEHARNCAADRAYAEHMRQKATDADRQCRAMGMRMDLDTRDAFKRWECAEYLSRFGRLESDGVRDIEPHPEFLALSASMSWL